MIFRGKVFLTGQRKCFKSSELYGGIRNSRLAVVGKQCASCHPTSHLLLLCWAPAAFERMSFITLQSHCDEILHMDSRTRGNAGDGCEIATSLSGWT